MATVTISPKFQVVIPKDIREKLGLEPGQKVQVVAQMQQGQVVELDASLALQAARLSVQEKLPMADNIMLATARTQRAILWTQDADFEGLNDVRDIAKRSPDG